MNHVYDYPDPIDPTVLMDRAGLATFEHHAAVGSTMERARELAQDADCPLPAAVVADTQSLGRGQRGARWWQAPGSLAVSVVVDAKPAAQAAGMPTPPAVWSLACGVALAESLAAVAPAIEPMLRWPNDIEANGRKLAGILVEATPGGRAIFGIGVNTTGSCEDAPPPLDKKIVTVPDLTGSPLPLLKGASVVGVFWGDFVRREPEANAAAMRELVQWHYEGRVRPHVSATYALADTPQALNDMASRKVTGKIVIRTRA
jgi:hypothetical protein